MNQDKNRLEKEKLESFETKKAIGKALKYLALRPRSRKELEEKLSAYGGSTEGGKNKKFEENIIKLVLEQIDKWGYLNDEDFAKSFCELKKFSRKGKIFIFQELKRKGVDEQIIKKTLSQFYPNKEESETALSLAKKKFPDLFKFPPEADPPSAEKSRKEIIKLKNFLCQRGFSWEVINELFRAISSF